MEQEAAGAPAAVEAPPFTLESAYAEAKQTAGEEPASSAAPPKTDAPSDSGQDTAASKAPASAEPTGEQPAGEEPAKSNRQAGKEAYERGRRDALAEFEQEKQRLQAETTTANQRRELDQLIADANLPDDGTFETTQKRTTAAARLGQLVASNHVTNSAYQRGQSDYEARFWSGFEGRLGAEIGLDDAGVKALMSEAHTGIDFAKRLVDHGRAAEKAVWEQEVARRDARIEELQGKLAAKTPSAEPGSGVRLNGAVMPAEIRTIEDAYRAAQALHAGG